MKQFDLKQQPKYNNNNVNGSVNNKSLSSSQECVVNGLISEQQ
jgi:hypothetical protein